jgi:pyridoxine/pyridoxamine 5'-phosphate oxidase
MPILKPDHSLKDMRQAVIAELLKGSVKKNHPFQNTVLSTIDGKKTASRWVVFRKLTDQETYLIFTDYRSDKVSQLKKNAQCALLFYHNRQGLQVRINGKAVIHHEDDLTKKYWPGIKGSSVKNYTTEVAPGTPITKQEEGLKWDAEFGDKHFAILEILPEKMDVLQLDRDGHIRVGFTREQEDWKGSFLVP